VAVKPLARLAFSFNHSQTSHRHRLAPHKGFRPYWTGKSRVGLGRHDVPREMRDLIRQMSIANHLWGAARIHGKLLKLGIDIAQSTVAKYGRKAKASVSNVEDLFLTNHLKDMVSTDFFEVPPSAFAFYLYSLYSLTIVASGQGSPPPIQIFNYQ
jgi:hypothetical protein